MNDTASAGGAPGASLIPSTTDAFTIAHLAIVAIFAIVVIAAIVWGSRLKRRRKAAERDIADHNAQVEQTTTAPAVAAANVDEPPVAAPAQTATPEPAPPAATDAAAPMPLADEPIAASAPLDAAPAIEAASVPDMATADAPAATLKGLGPKLAARLGELGIATIGQIAVLSDEDAARLDAQLGPFAGRMTRDRWIEQARFLASGDRAGFEAVFGRL